MRVFREIEVAELFNMLEENEQEIKLIDIRETAEFDRGAIPGAENIPVRLLPEKISQLDRDQIHVFYCQVGIRSAQICAWFMERGFAHVHNLRGGIHAWTHSGLRVA
ncbi:MAG TPA: rhodanese-like domain-containing protein [Gammaproteobacteria bacterium]|nr:rhodanese-like domain-containing protein [Gammaproteobacteria bacterium]